jgi:phosphopantetheinyl transferase
MPICYKIDNEDFTLGLWDLTEDGSQLFEEFKQIAPKKEVEKASRFKYSTRKSEWIATRLLLYHLLNRVVEIDYNLNGKPIIENGDQSISISHTKGMVAVIIAKNITGIDVEQVTDRVVRIEDRFLSGLEKNQIPEENKFQSILAYWSGKETLYKIYGDKGLDFKKNIYINPFNLSRQGEFIGEVITHNQTEGYCLNYFIHKHKANNESYLIVYYYN